MMRKLLLGAAIALACASAFGAAAEDASEMTMDSLTVDSTREEVSATGVSLPIDGVGELNAKAASFQIDVASVPRVMDVQDVRITTAGGSVISSSSGLYYPELRTLTADKITVSSVLAIEASDIEMAADGRSFTSSELQLSTNGSGQYTCSGGTLYEGSEPVPGNSACVNNSGGSVRITCSEGGNRVRAEFRVESCPVE